jgi:curved DNA-binding protein CbpA
MAFKNLYQLLSLKPTASHLDIVNAMKKAAQQQTISLEDLKLCKRVLLNEELRQKYNSRLFSEHPELLEAPPKPKEPEEVKPIPPKKTGRNNKKLYLTLAIIVAMIVCGAIAYSKYNSLVSEAKKAVKERLFKPDSATFYDIKIHFNTNNKKIYVCGKIVAKVLDGYYSGKETFVYAPHIKQAVVVPKKKPWFMHDQLKSSIAYKVGCLNDDPVKLGKQLYTFMDHVNEYGALKHLGPSFSDKVKQAKLDKRIVELETITEAELRAISIYENSDKEYE